MTKEVAVVSDMELAEEADNYARLRLEYLKSTGKLTLAYYGTEENLTRALKENFLRNAAEHRIVRPNLDRRMNSH